jgi:hypothetical protein
MAHNSNISFLLNRNSQWTWTHPTQTYVYIPAFFSAVSAITLLLHIVRRRRALSSQGSEYSATSSQYSGLQLAGCSILLFLSGVTLLEGITPVWPFQLSLFACYASTVLAFFSFSLTPVKIYSVVLALLAFFRVHETASKHLQILFSLCFLLYAYRDLWPLATWTAMPKDISEGGILWFKITLLAMVGLVLPLAQPRSRSKVRHPMLQTNSIHSQQDATPEETASLVSRLTYVFLDPLVLRARRETHIPLSELPRLAKSDSAANLVEENFPILNSQPQRLLQGLAKVFRTYKSVSRLLCLTIN